MDEPLDDIVATALREVLKAADDNGTQVLFALIGGSEAEGFAMSTSDIDLVVIQNDDTSRFTRQFVTCGRRVEATHYNLGAFRNVITTVRQGCTGPTFFRQLDSRRRLLFSKPIHGADRYHQEMQDARIQDFIDDVADFQRTATLGSFDDVTGVLHASRQDDDLRIRSRTYLECSVDVLLTSMGDYYFRDKWRTARIRRTLQAGSLDGLCNPISSLISGRPFLDLANLDDWLNYIFFYSALCQYIAMFKGNIPEHLDTVDWAQLASARSLHTPLLITEQGPAVLVRIDSSSLLLSPVLAYATCLSALGLEELRACALALRCIGGGDDENRIQALQLKLSAVNCRLEISTPVAGLGE